MRKEEYTPDQTSRVEERRREVKRREEQKRKGKRSEEDKTKDNHKKEVKRQVMKSNNRRECRGEKKKKR